MALCLFFLEDKRERDKNGRDGRRRGMGQGGNESERRNFVTCVQYALLTCFYALTLHKGCLCTTVGLQYKTFHSVNRNFISILDLDLDLDNNCQTPSDIAAMVWTCPTGVVTSPRWSAGF